MSAQLFYLPFNPVFTSRGLPAGAAAAYFYLTGTTTLATIYADGGLTTPLANPVGADALGRLPDIYLDSTITYRIRVVDSRGAPLGADIDPYIPGTAGGSAAQALAEVAALTDVVGRAVKVPIGETGPVTEPIAARASRLAFWDGLGDLISTSWQAVAAALVPYLPAALRGDKGDPGSPGEGYPTRTAIKALNPTSGDDVYLTETGREGKFVYRTGDYSAAVARDVREGIYLAPTTHPSGSSGAWIRQFDGPRNVKWWGVAGDGVTNDLPAFTAAIASFGPVGDDNDDTSFTGGELYVPRPALSAMASSQGYFLNGSWIVDKRIHIHGEHSGQQPTNAATRLIFPANTDGIVAVGLEVSGSSDAQFFRISGLCIYCASKMASGRGVVSSVRCYLEFTNIQNFASHGIQISGGTGAGNADAFSLRNVEIIDCGGDGVRISGSDAQVGTLFQTAVRNCGGWGFNDTCYYGNSYIECHAAGNALGSYRNLTPTTFFGSWYFKCYVEFGTGETPSLTADSVVLGGTLANVAGSACGLSYRSPGLFGPNVPSGTLHGWFRNGTPVMSLSTANKLSGMAELTVDGGTAGRFVDMGDQLITHQSELTGAQDHVRFRNGNGTVGSINVSGSTTTYNTSSDERLKENVTPVESALERIRALRPVDFTWKADGKPGRSFIAHELQAIVPHAVTGKKNETVAIGNLLHGDDVLKEGVEKPATIPEGCEWEQTGTEPRYQGVDMSQIMPDVVAAIQTLADRQDEVYRLLTANRA